jgi:dCMP deaminase
VNLSADIWDKRFLGLAEYYSSFSKDPSTKVGAVLVNDQNIVVGMGYNGFPRGVVDSEERLNNRDLKYKMVVHAEVNAILTAGHNAKGTRLYVYPAFFTPCICNECCKVAIQAGVKEIIGKNPVFDERMMRWKDSIEISKMMCDEAGVTYREV